jgi:hypothetical protein
MASSTNSAYLSKLAMLRELDLFAGLSDPDIEAIGHAAAMSFCTTGQLLRSPTDPGDRILIVKKGKVRVYRLTSDGKQLTLEIYDRGTILGDMRMLAQPAVMWLAVLPLIDPVMKNVSSLAFLVGHVMWGAALGALYSRLGQPAAAAGGPRIAAS